MKNMTKAALSGFALLLLVGCASMQYSEASLSEQLNYTQEVAIEYKTDESWWHAYQDTQLNALVEQALANKTDLAQSARTMQKAMYQANFSELDLYPTLAEKVGHPLAGIFIVMTLLPRTIIFQAN